MSIKVLAFTGIRSDYDLMSGLYQKIHEDPEMELGLIVSGAHLSESYGYTVRHIEADGMPILARIETLLDANSTSARVKSAAMLLQSCLHTVQGYAPDVILYPGDREDVVVGALIGAYLGIPTVHFFGGDHAADGNVDNPVRHATSKLSSLHFVTHDSHKQRLLAMGEPERRTFVIGNPALDRFVHTPWLEKAQLLQTLNRPEWQDYALVIYHPILGHETQAGEHFAEVLQALAEENIRAFVSYPNVDAGNKQIISVIQEYGQDERFCFYKNLERIEFINLMRHASIMVGNSSAGLLEAPSIPLGVVNVGARQRGRLAAENVVFVDQGVENIRQGIRDVRSDAFQARLQQVTSPYGQGDSVERAYQLLKTLPFQNYLLKCEDPAE